MRHTGMAGKDDLADAVLGGASDFISDIFTKIAQWSYAKEDQKVNHWAACTSLLMLNMYHAASRI